MLEKEEEKQHSINEDEEYKVLELPNMDPTMLLIET